MFGLSRKTDYAVLALARLSHRTSPAAEPMSARALAAAEALPWPVVSGLLKKLQRAGVVRSRRGVEGGYLLAATPDRITVADVVRAIEGPEAVRLVACCGGPHDKGADCELLARCPISQAIRRINDRLEDFLERLTLADLLSADTSDALAPAHAGTTGAARSPLNEPTGATP